MKTLHVFIIIVVVFSSASAVKAEHLPARAVYKAVLPENPHPKLVKSVEIAVDPVRVPKGKSSNGVDVAPGQPNLCWCRLTCTKIDGDCFTIWFLADDNPLNPDTEKTVSFSRYILQEPGQPPIEYIEQRSGMALLPLFNFWEELLPRATDDPLARLATADAGASANKILFEEGTFLGHPLVRQQILEPQPVAPPKNIIKFVLNPELLIGTSRNSRDDGTGKNESGDYNYVRFTKEDYDEMIAAGINYFRVDHEQLEWICRRPAFYERSGSQKVAEHFPEELYRSNFKGVVMFLDEPASRLAGKYPENASPVQAINTLHEHIIEHHDSNHGYGNRSYRSYLTKAGIDLGSLKLAEPDIPIWETIICTSYYQLEVLPTGIIQECRWNNWPTPSSKSMLHRVNAEFQANIPINPRNLFLWHYAQMRGAARTFNAKWGMAIYGQAEPVLRLPSMKLAYDLGASYIWFWTSDHDHHVPYQEQLELTRALIDYTKSHPRQPLDKLLRHAKTVIVLPYGYTLPGCYGLAMFGSEPFFPLQRKNQLGIPYKRVLAGAIRQIERCLKNNISYDVVIAGKDFDPTDYDEVVWIDDDGTVRISENRSPSTSLDVAGKNR